MLTVLILIDFESLTYWEVFVLTLLSAASLLLQSLCCSFAIFSQHLLSNGDVAVSWQWFYKKTCASFEERDAWVFLEADVLSEVVDTMWIVFEISTILACTWCFMQSLEKCLSLHLRSRNVELRLCNWLLGKQNRVGFCLPFNFAFISSHCFLCSSLARRIFAVCVVQCFCKCCLRTHQFG